MEFTYEEIKASTKGFSEEQLIGKGSHGCVYRATLRDGERVAVKKPSVVDASKLDNEIRILSSVRNPNIVNFIGFSILGTTSNSSQQKLLVTEYMPNGSLHCLLHSSSSSPRSRPLSWARRIRIALQVARAAHSLHEAEPSIVHRDIKPANILFDRRWRARLGDFSLAVMAHDSAALPAGTLGYLDPSYTEPGKVGPENDVFSLGVVLLELFSSTRAMEMDRVDGGSASVVEWAVPMIRDGRALEVCDGRVGMDGKMGRMVGKVLAVAERCVSSEEERRRPTMAEVVVELRGVAECIWWPSWECLKNKASLNARRCVQAWKRCKEKRVTTTTTKIVCKDHLIASYGDEGGGGGGGVDHNEKDE